MTGSGVHLNFVVWILFTDNKDLILSHLKRMGTIYHLRMGKEHLVLSTGLTGQFCEINIDDCEKEPCGVLSICKDSLNGYNCFCAPGFIGK